MIRAIVDLDDRGLLWSCAIDGHADYAAEGADIVCAAVSVLARTALRTLSTRDSASIEAVAPVKGSFNFALKDHELDEGFLRGVTEFLTVGLESIAREYPKNCSVRIRTERRH